MKILSTQQRKKNTLVAESKKKLLKESQVCRICGKFAPLDLAHILPKSIFPEHYTREENHTLLCRDCHVRFDNELIFRREQLHLYEQAFLFDPLSANRYFRFNY
jgi:5-methylcytosine-specific restriction endonuclease McrA